MIADEGAVHPRESDVGSGALTLQRPAVKKGQVGGAVAGSWRLWWGLGVGGRNRAGRRLLGGLHRSPVVMQRQVPSSPLIGGAPDPVHRQWLDIPVMLQRRVPTVQTGQMTDEILQVPFLDWLLTRPSLRNAHMHSSRSSRSSTSLSWRRGCFPMVLFSRPLRFPCCSPSIRCSMSTCWAGPNRFHGCCL